MSTNPIPTKLEHAYFHIENGGLSLAVEEEVHVRECIVFPPDWHDGLRAGKYTSGQDLPTETRYNRYWFLKLSQYHFGAGTSYRFPLTPVMVRWALEALTRVLQRMEAPQERPGENVPFGLDRDYCKVAAVDGQEVDIYWPPGKEPKFGWVTQSDSANTGGKSG